MEKNKKNSKESDARGRGAYENVFSFTRSSRREFLCVYG